MLGNMFNPAVVQAHSQPAPAPVGAGAGRQGQQIKQHYIAIILLDLLDLSRTPGAVCQSIHNLNAPVVVAGIVS